VRRTEGEGDKVDVSSKRYAPINLSLTKGKRRKNVSGQMNDTGSGGDAVLSSSAEKETGEHRLGESTL